jgi:hypothetical protein
MMIISIVHVNRVVIGMQQKTQLNDCAGSQAASLLQPVAPVALGALYAALSDKDRCQSLATKGLFATGFLQGLHQLRDDKPACFTLCACWACVASVQLQGTTPEITACSIYQPKVLKGILSYVCTTSLERVRTESYLQAFHPHSLRLSNQSSYVEWVSRPV